MIHDILEFLDIDAVRAPDKVALEDEYRTLTYSQLAAEAGVIGSYIAHNLEGVRNHPVAVIIDRNVRTVAAFFGVVYSGNFYVPVDASMPAERIVNILNTLHPVMIIDAREKSNGFDSSVSYDDIISSEKRDDGLLTGIRMQRIDEDPLYAIFTSGSTGIPKGVLISHRSVLDLVYAFEDAFSFESDTVFCNQAPFDFDVSVKDIYNSLYVCGRIVIAPRKLFMSPKMLNGFLVEKGVNTLIWAVSALRILSDF